jgi:hypothetical protein
MSNNPSSRASILTRLNPMIRIPSGKWSTGALMRVIVPVALELVLFNEVWYLVLMPPITIVVLVCNLGLFFVLVRPRSMETRILGMMLGGVAAVFASAAYYLLGDFPRNQVGVLGSLARGGLVSWEDSLAFPKSGFRLALELVRWQMRTIEGVLVVLLGMGMIWTGGRLDKWCRTRWIGGRERRQAPSIANGPDSAVPSQ